MSGTVSLSKLLADSLRAKATATIKSVQTPTEWGRQYVPHFFFRKGCQFHEDLSVILDNMSRNRGQKTLIMAPRGNAKSTICSMVAPLKAICECTEKYILLISDTSEQAQGYLKSIRDELDYNDVIKARYPLACKHGDQWNNDRIETASGVCIEALGKGKSVRGRKFKQYRLTLVILDDPQNDDDVASPTTRGKDIAWFDKALVPAGDTETNFFIIGTNLHRESIVNVVSQRADFKVVKYSSITIPPTNTELWQEWERIYITGHGKEAQDYYDANKEMMEEGANVLWPEKENLLDLMTMKINMGSVAFACEKQNDPRDPNKCEFDESWFEDCEYTTIPPEIKDELITVGYCDPAKGGETKRHDYSAIVLLSYSPTLGRCFVTCDIKRRPVNITIDAIIRWIDVLKPEVFGCEINGFQELMADEIVAKAPLAPIVGIQNQGVHKNTRISRLSIWLQRKFFIFRAGCKDTRLLRQQLLDHPTADHDDGSDALEGCLRLLTSISNLQSSNVIDTCDDGIGDNIFAGNPYL